MGLIILSLLWLVLLGGPIGMIALEATDVVTYPCIQTETIISIDEVKYRTVMVTTNITQRELNQPSITIGSIICVKYGREVKF